MNKKTTISITLSTAIAVALMGVVFGMNAPQQIEQQLGQQKYIPGDLPPPEPILTLMPGKAVSNALDAATMTKYSVKEPTYLPEGYQVRTINVDDINRITIMLISKYPVNEQTTDREFTWDQGGIWLSYSILSPNFNKEKFMSGWLAQNSGKRISINGYDVVVHEIITGKTAEGSIAHSPAELVLLGDKTVLSMSGFLPTAELVKIASSMQ